MVYVIVNATTGKVRTLPSLPHDSTNPPVVWRIPTWKQYEHLRQKQRERRHEQDGTEKNYENKTVFHYGTAKAQHDDDDDDDTVLEPITTATHETNERGTTTSSQPVSPPQPMHDKPRDANTRRDNNNNSKNDHKIDLEEDDDDETQTQIESFLPLRNKRQRNAGTQNSYTPQKDTIEISTTEQSIHPNASNDINKQDKTATTTMTTPVHPTKKAQPLTYPLADDGDDDHDSSPELDRKKKHSRCLKPWFQRKRRRKLQQSRLSF